ncbi:MAG: transketolase family protein [Alphaproteobacteria bacterium]|nr:transketolase family protein [Alphaproteobacteria bacterium]
MFFWQKSKDNFTAREIRTMANAVRALSIDQIQAAQSGHPGAPLGMADIVTTLFVNHLRFNPNMPDWAERDKFVLSAGHASAMLYATLCLAGYDISIKDLRRFRQFGIPTQGHPEYNALPGIEASTGSLGQGVANAVGMAFAAKIKSAPTRVYCLCSDGDLMEGVSQEAISLAGFYKLNNLVLLWDNNRISIDGSVVMADDMPARFLSAGWATIEVNGLKPRQINRALHIAKRMNKPTFISCKTTIGYMSEHAGSAKVHGTPLAPDDATTLLQRLRRGGDSFTISPIADSLWVKLRNIKKKTPTVPENTNPATETDGQVPKILENLAPSSESESTRKIFGRAIKIAMGQMPKQIIGGSADLAESTCARPDIAIDITAQNMIGNYIHYGVREHAMAAVMNGLALSGLRPYGSTFLVFSDYMRPAIRMSAIMGLPVTYIFTHDSIALGEDGKTHQPVEQLASLRLIPNLHVMRPANATEVAICTELALCRKDGPSAIILSRQDFPVVTSSADPKNIEKGAYILQESWKPEITIIATGSEIPLAMKVWKILAGYNVSAQVVSMPCVERFRLQSEEYKSTILPGHAIVIEAGAMYAWHEFAVGVFGMDTFGTGGKGAEIYNHFGFDAVTIAKEIIKNLK